MLAQTHHHLTGIGADLPVVGPIFEKYVASHGLRERLRFQALDFFREPFPRADVVIMGAVSRAKGGRREVVMMTFATVLDMRASERVN